VKTLFLLLAFLVPHTGVCDSTADALAMCRYFYRDTDAKGGSSFSRDRDAAAAANQRSAFVHVSGAGSFIYSIESDSLKKTTLSASEFSAQQGLARGDASGGQAFLVLKMTGTPKGVEGDLGITTCHGLYFIFTRNEETAELRYSRGIVKCCF
jgi:hypothetical protein